MNEPQVNHAHEITRLHDEIAGHLRASVEKAIRIGELLTEQKASLPHGEFGCWIREHLRFSDRTARNYMNLYEHRDRLKSETVSDLSEAYALLRRPGLPCAVDTPTNDEADRQGPAAEELPDWMPGVGEMNIGEGHRGGETARAMTLKEKLDAIDRKTGDEVNQIMKNGIGRLNQNLAAAQNPAQRKRIARVIKDFQGRASALVAEAYGFPG